MEGRSGWLAGTDLVIGEIGSSLWRSECDSHICGDVGCVWDGYHRDKRFYLCEEYQPRDRLWLPRVEEAG